MEENMGKCPVCGGEWDMGELEIFSCCYCENQVSASLARLKYEKAITDENKPEQITQEAKTMHEYVSFGALQGDVEKATGVCKLSFSLKNNYQVPITSFLFSIGICDLNTGECLTTLEGEEAIHTYRKLDINLRREEGWYSKDLNAEKTNITLNPVGLANKKPAFFLNWLAVRYANNLKITIRSEVVPEFFELGIAEMEQAAPAAEKKESSILEDIKAFNPMDSSRMFSQRQIENGEAEEKSWLVYAFLGYFGGAIGAHNFYAGNKKRAMVQLGLSCTLIGCGISIIWGVMEASTAFSSHHVPDYTNNKGWF